VRDREGGSHRGKVDSPRQNVLGVTSRLSDLYRSGVNATEALGPFHDFLIV
jgi:hypothetical protein